MSETRTIPKRASRETTTIEVDEQYDDKLINNPRSALHYRSTSTNDVPQSTRTNRISGSTRAILYILLFLCIAFLVSGFNSPMLSGNVITIHIPLVWIIGIVGVFLVALALVKSR